MPTKPASPPVVKKPAKKSKAKRKPAAKARRRAAAKPASPPKHRLTMAKTLLKAGRPSDYKPEYPERIFKFLLLNPTASYNEMGRYLGVAGDAISRWVTKYREFRGAIEAAQKDALSNVLHGMYCRSVGGYQTIEKAVKYKLAKDHEDVKIVEVKEYIAPDTNAAKFLLTNWTRRGGFDGSFSDRVETGISAPDGGPIQVDDTVRVRDMAMRYAYLLANLGNHGNTGSQHGSRHEPAPTTAGIAADDSET